MLQWTLLWSFLTRPFNLNLNMSFFAFFISFSQTDCPNGRLTPAKFVDMYKMFFPSGNAEEFCDHVFRTFDMDKNGYIDFKVSQSSFTLIFIFYFHPTISRSETFTLISFKVIPINFAPLTMLTIATLYGNTLISWCSRAKENFARFLSEHFHNKVQPFFTLLVFSSWSRPAIHTWQHSPKHVSRATTSFF